MGRLNCGGLSMAIWQLSFYAVDKSKKIVDDEIYCWKEKYDKFCNINFLEKKESWANWIIQFGEVDSTCIEILMDDEISFDVRIRLDIRNLKMKTIKCIIDYLCYIDANILYDEKIIVPTKENVIKMILESDAYRFCKSPTGFLDELKVQKNILDK